jgi:hypothetical protein
VREQRGSNRTERVGWILSEALRLRVRFQSGRAAEAGERLLTRNGRQACYATGVEFGDVKRFTFEYRGLSYYQVQTPLMTSIGLPQSGNMIPSERRSFGSGIVVCRRLQLAASKGNPSHG